MLWDWDGTLGRIHEAPYVAFREATGREASLTAAIIRDLLGEVRVRPETLARIAELSQHEANGCEFSRKLAGTATLDDLVWAAAHRISLLLKVSVVLLLPENGGLAVKAGSPP